LTVAQVELEAKLAVVSQDPRVLASEISELTEVGEFTLVPRSDTRIRDIYFDTADGRLAALRINLRLRLSDDQTLITVKGRDTSTSQGLSRREYEVPWSAEGLTTGLRLLSEMGAATRSPPQNLVGDPLGVLERLGFRAIQERETSRCRRDVARAGNDTILAELVVDSVTFLVGVGCSVRHHEVEIELGDPSDPTVLEHLAKELVRRWPELRPWPYSKVATGLAIVALLERGELAGRAEAVDLTPRDYDLIAVQLGPPLS